ncbi:MAG: hypothetical protein J6Q75_02455, partial [Bacteroidaceae bacterium]|nr:hypothetical protein [Bacteroidaceae bacterium]
MTKYQLYRLIVEQKDIKDKRHPMFEKNRFMKILMWFNILYYAAILIFLGCTFSMFFGDIYPGVAAFHVLDGALVWILIIDFWVR